MRLPSKMRRPVPARRGGGGRRALYRFQRAARQHQPTLMRLRLYSARISIPTLKVASGNSAGIDHARSGEMVVALPVAHRRQCRNGDWTFGIGQTPFHAGLGSVFARRNCVRCPSGYFHYAIHWDNVTINFRGPKPVGLYPERQCSVKQFQFCSGGRGARQADISIKLADA